MDSDDLGFFDEVIDDFVNFNDSLLIEDNWLFDLNFLMNDGLNSLNDRLFDDLLLNSYNFLHYWFFYDSLNNLLNFYPL